MAKAGVVIGVILLLIALGVGGYFAYKHFFNKKKPASGGGGGQDNIDVPHACTNGTCAPDPSGPFPNAQMCLASGCKAPPASTNYACVGGICQPSASGSFMSLGACLASGCHSSGKGPFDCTSLGCVASSTTAGAGKYPDLTSCQTACANPAGKDQVPSQEWINQNLMLPDPSQQGNKSVAMVWDYSTSELCTVSANGNLTTCGAPCPFGMTYSPDANTCVDVNCPPGATACSRGIPINPSTNSTSVLKPPGLKVLLTNYATPDASHGSNMSADADVFAAFIEDMIHNFCVPRKVDIFTLYYTPPISSTKYPYYKEPTWIITNFIAKAEAKGIVAGVNVYPSFKDSPWPKDTSDNNETWTAIGQSIGEVNQTAKKKYSLNGIKYLVFDGEECSCGDDSQIRSLFAQGYEAGAGEPLPTDFVMMKSESVNATFGKNPTPNDYGLGEVYWNVNELWPCKGNDSQFSNYAKVCKEWSGYRYEGSNGQGLINQPEATIDWLVAASKTKNSDAPLVKSTYITAAGQQQTVPLFSTEALYQQVDGNTNGMLCAAMNYYAPIADTVVDPEEKICGTFDGFAYWDGDKFFDFLYMYATKFGLGYVGIYDAMFIPQKWMTGGKWATTSYAPALPPTWPVLCAQPQNKCVWDCLAQKVLPCTDNSVCVTYCPSASGYCKTNKTCHFSPPASVDTSKSDENDPDAYTFVVQGVNPPV